MCVSPWNAEQPDLSPQPLDPKFKSSRRSFQQIPDLACYACTSDLCFILPACPVAIE